MLIKIFAKETTEKSWTSTKLFKTVDKYIQAIILFANSKKKSNDIQNRTCVYY